MSDLIDRQEAIKAVGVNTWAGSRLNALPSAQPEIIRCKDCKYQDKGQNEVESWNVCNYRPRLYVSIDDDDYCSSGERKGGLTDDHNTGKI